MTETTETTASVSPALKAGYALLVVALRAAAEWLWQDPEQPEGTLMTHHGIYLRTQVGGLKISFCPRAANGRPVFVFDRPVDRDPVAHSSRNPYTEEEIGLILQAVSEALSTIEPGELVDSWNGAGYNSFSVSVLPAVGPNLRRILQTYHEGCQGTGPEHRTGSVFCPCGWWKVTELAVRPEGWA